VSRDKSVKRSAQDDDFVGVLKKNIPNKLALMGHRPMTPPVKMRAGGISPGKRPFARTDRAK
jgi:hypothetical protein